MPKLTLAILVTFSALVLAGCTVPFLSGKQAALQITSNPTAKVYLNDDDQGSTPFFQENLKPGEYKIKLAPEGGSVEWESRVNLTAGVMTVISRDMGPGQDESSGYTLSLEAKTDKDSSSVAVVTNPDGAVVSLDEEPKGFAPLSVDNVIEGEHSLTISSPGFVEKNVRAKTVNGYKLIISVQLAKMAPTQEETSQEATESAEEDVEEDTDASPSPKASPKSSPKSSPTSSPTADEVEMERPYVLIKSPTAGWVRVRSEPSTTGEEIGKANDGLKYPYLDSDSGWYQIDFDGEKGWISGQYAELYK